MPEWGGWGAGSGRAERDSDPQNGQNYRTLIELCPDALIVHDGKVVILANAAMARLVGASRIRELIGYPLSAFVAPSSHVLVEERVRQMHFTGPEPLTDETWRRMDGTEVEVEVAAAPAPWIGPRAAMVIARDVTVRRLLEAERETLLAEKELLMREVHHRAANSLHMVQGLLNLQARDTENDEVRFQLSEAAARIGTIGTLHSRLQKGRSALESDVKAYIEGVMSDLRTSLGETYRRQIVLDATDARGVSLQPDSLVALGLIAAEAVTNAIKHGEGHIRVGLVRSDEHLEMAIEDDGPGFPEGFDPMRDGRGLGMRMIASLAQWRGGRLVMGDTTAPNRIVAILPLQLSSALDPQ